MFKKHKVVMLSTRQESKLLKLNFDRHASRIVTITNRSAKEVYWDGGFMRKGAIGDKDYQHLYILSDEEIKEDDWGLNIYEKGIVQANNSNCYSIQVQEHWMKIIASTDQSLGLPRPSDSFIQNYCELGGIDEVMIEYEECQTYIDDACDYRFPCCSNPIKLKVAPDNTITIKKVKDSWTRAELIAIVHKAFEAGELYGRRPKEKDLDTWIKENL